MLAFLKGRRGTILVAVLLVVQAALLLLSLDAGPIFYRISFFLHRSGIQQVGLAIRLTASAVSWFAARRDSVVQRCAAALGLHRSTGCRPLDASGSGCPRVQWPIVM